MTRGFYEQLGTSRDADLDELRGAYTRVVTQLIKRRKAIVEQGGDPSQLDLDRSQLEEAWEVVSDPERRRKYDAMLDVMDGDLPDNAEVLWKKVQPAFVDPAAAAATKLLDQTTRLGVGRLESRGGLNHRVSSFTEAPDKTLIPHPEDEGAPTGIEEIVHDISEVVPLPSAADKDPNDSLRVVEGTRQGSPIIVLPTAAPSQSQVAPETVASLIELHGYSGALLSAVRQELRMTLDDLSENTNIAKGYLEAIESDGFDRLPAATFVRGYVRVLASTLGLDEQAVVSGYMKNYSA
tara:strand:+ start:151 stop:1032 length:882 start_codon:yes stop_codon:yes gene_type:complete